MDRPRLLIVDDEEGVRSSLSLLLEEEGYEVDTAEGAEAALAHLRGEPFNLVLCDVRMPGRDGLELLPELIDLQPDLSVLMMSAYGAVDQALEAVRLGASDYIAKPFEPQELLLLLRKTQERERLRRENVQLRRELGARHELKSLVAVSAEMQEVVALIDRAGAFKTTVLITGESGVGKDMVARAIHHRSGRASQPFVPVNCGAIPENLMEAELFGHARGAFTGADQARAGLFRDADGGTLFLDEIGELPLYLQVKLLRVLQEEEVRPVGESRSVRVDVRIVAATARDLQTEVRAGRFRQDLFYRLNVFCIDIPPLRDRPADIPPLAHDLLRNLARQTGKRVMHIDPEAMEMLCAYPWPGNVRELENTLERAMILALGDRISVDLLPLQGMATPSDSPSLETRPEDLSIKRRTRALEERLIRLALEQTGGNRTRAAEILEISPRALQYKLKEYGIVPLNPLTR
jgi:two-component system response regulator AtoC